MNTPQKSAYKLKSRFLPFAFFLSLSAYWVIQKSSAAQQKPVAEQISAAEQAEYEGPLRMAREKYAESVKTSEDAFKKILLECNTRQEAEEAQYLYLEAIGKADAEFTASMETLSHSLKSPHILLALDAALQAAKVEHQNEHAAFLKELPVLTNRNHKLMTDVYKDLPSWNLFTPLASVLGDMWKDVGPVLQEALQALLKEAGETAKSAAINFSKEGAGNLAKMAAEALIA